MIASARMGAPVFRSSGQPIYRWLAILLLTGGLVSLSAQQVHSTDEHVPSASPQRALINQYCVGCHNNKLRTGGVALDTVSVENVSQNPEIWEKVLRKVRARYMPPVGVPRPDEKGYQSLVSYLETALDEWSTAYPNPGRTATLRRLTRTEYQNAIRDLLGLQVDVTQLLPGDESSFGFDNILVGELSPALLERYLAAARKISRLAVGTPVRSPTGETVLIPQDLTQEEHFDELPFGTRGGTAVHYIFPQDGKYDITFQLTRDRNEHIEGLGEPADVDLLLDGGRVQTFTVKPVNDISGIRNANSIPNDDLVDKHLHIRIPVTAGPHTLAVTFPKANPALLQETERQPYQAHFNMYRHPRLHPALYSIVVVGPYEANGPGDTPSRRRIFVCRPAKPAVEDGCANQILSKLARRAYRRPVTEADLQMPLKFYREIRATDGFEAGIERGLRSLLISPEFLFRVERDPENSAPNTAYRITDLELASRLSFFLWSSIPDDELLDLAIAGKLKDPAVLEKQVGRMLTDARSESLVNNFADQWLYLRNLENIIPDARLFPDYDDNLRQAMRRETELFFESIVRENHNAVDLLRANYTFLNERLAKHYGVPNVYDSYFRRVTFDASSARGGLLGQGSILTLTSYADRTSPVIRGKWILTNIVGSPPPLPPPNVPPLKDNAAAGKVLTMRERMAAHRVNQPCAGCHRLMDPVGFSLENYDAIGRWRTTEQDMPIDSSGSLPDGSQFVSVSGLRAALLSRPELFVTTLTEKLLTYGLGRGLDYYDAAAVRKIVRDARNHDYRFASLISGIVNSTPFQMRRSQ
jgi:mono/diheme cytochrome c family protein